jgi:hypothetical protein
MASLGSTPGIIVGIGVGTAASVALEPAIEVPKQEAWKRNPNRLLGADIVARLVAQGGVTLDNAREDAIREGLSNDKLDALVYLSQTVPPVAEALTLWRRGLISDALWKHVLVKAGLDGRYVDGLTRLKVSEPLDPAVIANAIQRGIVKDPGFLPVSPPTATGKVPPFPASSIDAVAEAEASGVSRERLFVETAIVGRPLSLQQAASAYFRRIIERPDYDRAVAEGDTRNEWGPAALEQAREILTAHDYAELQLRGYLTRDQRLAGTGQHGMSDADSDLLYDVLGRSIPVHQITTGLARGGVYKGDTSQIPEAYLSSLERGNLRPEYYSLAYANRYSLPSSFFLRALLTSGEISAKDAEGLFLEYGWPPKWATKIAESLATSASPVADKHVAKAQTSLWSTTHRSYVAQESTDADARERFTLLGIGKPAQDAILKLWSSERALIRKQLSPTQVRKAYTGGVANPATGRPWTEQEALQALLDRGYARDDATVFLAE